MAKGSLIEQLDQAVEAILANPDAPLPRVNARVLAPLRIAVELRGLPRPDFKARLKADLERRASVTTAVKPIREGFHTVTPYLIVPEAAELIDFVKQAFGAEELLRAAGSAGGIHAEVRIDDSMVMIGEEGPGADSRCPPQFTSMLRMRTLSTNARCRPVLHRWPSRWTSFTEIAKRP